MKKVIAILLAVVLMLSVSVIAFADGTTTLTTTVPGASYTMEIPADMEIPYNTTTHPIGIPTISESAGFSVGKSVRIKISSTYAFTSPSTDTTIPFILHARYSGTYTTINDSFELNCKGRSTGTVAPPTIRDSTDTLNDITVGIAPEAWGAAKPGQYTATVTFTSEIVTP